MGIRLFYKSNRSYLIVFCLIVLFVLTTPLFSEGNSKVKYAIGLEFDPYSIYFSRFYISFPFTIYFWNTTAIAPASQFHNLPKDPSNLFKFNLIWANNPFFELSPTVGTDGFVCQFLAGYVFSSLYTPFGDYYTYVFTDLHLAYVYNNDNLAGRHYLASLGIGLLNPVPILNSSIWIDVNTSISYLIDSILTIASWNITIKIEYRL